MGSSRTKSRSNSEREPSKLSLAQAREVVQRWEHKHTHHDDLVVEIAWLIDQLLLEFAEEIKRQVRA